MAKAAAHKGSAIAIEMPECPVCLETMTAPIFQCQSGHSLCNSCTRNLLPPICPICRQQMTQMRNWQLEEMLAKATIACPNKSFGCVYTMPSVEVDDHIKECIFREMRCPLGLVFGKCFWSGKLKEIMTHFKESHPENCNIFLDKEGDIDMISTSNDDRLLYLLSIGNFLFLLNVKIDTSEKMAFWAVQHIGSKKFAKQYKYEIQIISKQDKKRQVKFSDSCYNDTYDTNEIFREMNCGVMPLKMLNNFIRDNKISIIVSIAKPQNFKNKENTGNADNRQNHPRNNPNAQNKSRTESPGPNNSNRQGQSANRPHQKSAHNQPPNKFNSNKQSHPKNKGPKNNN